MELPRRRPNDWQVTLRQALDPLRAAYDLILVDTDPGLGILPCIALVAADAVLIAQPADLLAYRALPSLLETIDQARRWAPGMPALGIVPTFTGTRTRHETEVLALLEDQHADLQLPAIPRRVVVADAAVAGEPVTRFGPLFRRAFPLAW